MVIECSDSDVTHVRMQRQHAVEWQAATSPNIYSDVILPSVLT